MVLSIHCQNNVIEKKLKRDQNNVIEKKFKRDQNNIIERKLRRDPFPKPQQGKGRGTQAFTQAFTQAPKTPSNTAPLQPNSLQTSQPTGTDAVPSPTIPTILPVINNIGIKSSATVPMGITGIGRLIGTNQIELEDIIVPVWMEDPVMSSGEKKNILFVLLAGLLTWAKRDTGITTQPRNKSNS
ncbi:12716_t:CDS:2 [Dentiscutata erythropus]|uniref:12716_t:CDS:1 n=1 Tax=Dentiscutata erythropus TaxID=1348616 RepID=A0A9N9I4U9_9GLOM|nr:12716_t:CDS:2 [Dentiscutata erythropus]